MSLRETLNKIRSSPIPQNEETAKFRILRPILDSLGWDTTSDQEVQYEHLGGGKGGGKVDFALGQPDQVVALIEAKRPGANLGDHVGQVLGYAFYDGVDICVLTTGVEWWLYLPREAGLPEERRFATLQIRDDPIEQLADDLSTFLGKANLLSREAERRAKQVLEARREADRLNTEIPEVRKQMQAGPDDELVDLVRKRVYEKVNLRPAREQVAAVLRGSRVPLVVTPDPPTPSPVPKPTPPDANRTATPKPTGIRLWEKRYDINYWKDIPIRVAEALHERHAADFDRVLTLQGRKIPRASRNPYDLPRARAEVGSSGIYIHVHGSSTALKKSAIRMLELFGHDPADLEILYD